MNKRYIHLLVLLLLLFPVLSAAACSSEGEDTKLVVGMELAYPPFEMTDDQNNPTGISIDFAKALGEELGREIVIENMAWAGLIPSLETGKIDLIISSMTITEDRKKQVDFSDPYAMANLALLINKDSPVESYADLDQPGRVIAVKKGSSGHIYAEKTLKNATIQVFDKESVCVLEVVQGKADAFTYDQLTIYKNWQQYPDKTRVNLVPYQEAPEFWGVALRKGETELKDQVNAFIAKFRSEGGFDALAEQYLTEQKKTFDELQIPFFFDVGDF
ncbi:MAG: transporter substrate-binding domain-containing protein [Bacillota bacterium]|nr:transporter substrate-binding domain-containing protein [Bacillota bacterium]